MEPDGKWYCAACVEEFYEDMEAERQRQELGEGVGVDQARKHGATGQTGRGEGGDKGPRQEEAENASSETGATVLG